jgi:uncharacterized protein YgbK (DUF1537 family)
LEPLLLAGISVPDVASLPDVSQAATLVDDSTLAAGAADFFETMLDRWQSQSNLSRAPAAAQPIYKPALLICGSRVAWPQRLAACEAAQIKIYSINGLRTWLGNDGSRPLESVAGLLGIGDDNHPDPNRALRELGALASLAINDFSAKTLLLEGGATAAAVVSHLGWKRFSVQPAATPGVGFLQPFGDPNAPMLLIKPGSYPWPPEIWQSFCG